MRDIHTHIHGQKKFMITDVSINVHVLKLIYYILYLSRKTS